jgi:ribosomal protein S27AE
MGQDETCDRFLSSLQIKYLRLVFDLDCLRVDFSIAGRGEPMMQIIAQCPRCGSAWLLSSTAADRRVKCRKCFKLFKIPKLEEVPKAIKVIKRAKGTIYVDESGKTYG